METTYFTRKQEKRFEEKQRKTEESNAKISKRKKIKKSKDIEKIVNELKNLVKTPERKDLVVDIEIESIPTDVDMKKRGHRKLYLTENGLKILNSLLNLYSDGPIYHEYWEKLGMKDYQKTIKYFYSIYDTVNLRSVLKEIERIKKDITA